MKKMLIVLVVAGVTGLFSQNFRQVTVKEIQKVHQDSLVYLDEIGAATNPNWTKQVSPFYNAVTAKRETVVVVGLVVVPPKTITYTAWGTTMCIIDTGVTSASEPWRGLFVYFAASQSGGTLADTAIADQMKFYNAEVGDIVKITGWIDEFPTGSTISSTQIALVKTTKYPVEVTPGYDAPTDYPVVSVAEFIEKSKLKPSTGERWEGQKVILTGLTVVGYSHATRKWQLSLVDDFGNLISTYDWSKYFTNATSPWYIVGLGAPIPAIGTRIDTLKGFITTSAGSNSSNGYRIAPIFPGDVVYSTYIKPGVVSHRRNPVIVTKDSAATITAKVFKQTSNVKGATITSIRLVYKVDGVWDSVAMSTPNINDSISTGVIPKRVAGKTVYYFIKATDSLGYTSYLANSGEYTYVDTSKGLFFYTVYDRSVKPVLSPKDVQTTPFANGRSPYIGAIDSVGGIVTADTSALRITSQSSYGTNGWYIQSGNQPFSGIWVNGPEAVMSKLTIGDSVIVTGNISEFEDVTEVYNITSARVVSKGNPLPEPVVFATNVFSDAAVNGDVNAEPYEGMLVKFQNVTVSSIAPTFGFEDEEYSVSNSNLSTLIRRDGRNTYTNFISDTALGFKFAGVGAKFSSMTGIVHYSGKRYKIVPRTNADFQGFSPVLGVATRYVSVATEYTLGQNYPNPFNPTTTLRFSIPVSGNVSLKVFNVIGQEVATLVDGFKNVGVYEVNFDASRLSSGMYLYRISSGSYSQVRKMLLLK